MRLGVSLLFFCTCFGVASPGYDPTRLFSRAWQFTGGEPNRPAGAMYIFLPNGTLLETSCVETYRVATWTTDKENPSAIRVMEDGRLAFVADITELSNTRLGLRQTLTHGSEKHNLTLKAVEGEFVCPDLRK